MHKYLGVFFFGAMLALFINVSPALADVRVEGAYSPYPFRSASRFVGKTPEERVVLMAQEAAEDLAINRQLQIGFAVFGLAVAGGGYWFFQSFRPRGKISFEELENRSKKR